MSVAEQHHLKNLTLHELLAILLNVRHFGNVDGKCFICRGGQKTYCTPKTKQLKAIKTL